MQGLTEACGLGASWSYSSNQLLASTVVNFWQHDAFTFGFFFFIYLAHIIVHCPKINLNLCIKTEPITTGAYATVYTVYVRFFPLDEQRYLICTTSGEISNISRMNRKEDTVVLFCFG